MIQYVEGDATDPRGEGFKIIAHICNDSCAWGAGFVLALSRKWSEPEARYRAWCKSQDRFELGGVQAVQVEPDIAVANMIGQVGTASADGIPPIRYEAVRTCLRRLGLYAQRRKASIHMPRIGCALAGGSWSRVEPIIETELEGIQVTVYDWPAGPGFNP